MVGGGWQIVGRVGGVGRLEEQRKNEATKKQKHTHKQQKSKETNKQ
jgi:hypothetical protein